MIYPLRLGYTRPHPSSKKHNNTNDIARNLEELPCP